MVIYLRHPTHGTKVAVGEQEAQADEKNGWVRYTIAPTQTEAVIETNKPLPKGTLTLPKRAAG